MKFPFRKSNQADTTNAVEEAGTIDGERAAPSVNKGLGMQTKITNFVIFGAIILGTLFFLWKYYANLIEQRREAQQAAQKDSKTQQQTVLPPLVPPQLPTSPTTTTAGTTAPAAPASGTVAANGQQVGPDGKPILTPEQERLQRRLNSAVKFKLDNTSPAPGAAPAVADAGPDAGPSGAGAPAGLGGGGSDDPLARSLRATYTPGAVASVLPHRDFLITKGAVIHCTIDPALDSTVPGIVTCTGSDDVWSTNHKVKLMEAGTKYVGEAKQGLLQGQRRMAVLWTRAETPNGVVIDLNSGAADELGRPGVGVEVDNHFWQRFGAAIMFSLLSDTSAYLIAREQNNGSGSNNTTIAFPNTINGSQNIIGDILKQTMDIPPTGKKNQAASINIYVARDLDFSTVYDLKVTP
ncbi:type IV secretion system protein VirB10 [Burkholderia multivorans]|uniref:type IV secretion system protein VirB10 n=1 Tax=Burkholderia multivorans TaxID=87883 RepID=UPI000D003026|nr:type IV secretion system protein VirB10 [Burkholderia multivorans]MBU9122938.1 type IV secretion system protein VirB10 [Burkholderia multivorans]PRG49499.1 conjugal transfer protein TrbI [Burkholderia multivorans]